MQLQYIFSVLFLTSVFSANGITLEEHAKATEAIIQKEIERFNTIKDKFVENGINAIAQFSISKINDDGSLIKSETFELRPLVEPKKTLDEESKTFNRDNLKLIFSISKKHNISAAASAEVFDENGILSSKTVFADYVSIRYDDGDSVIRIRDDPTEDDSEDDESVEDLINLLKEFELPVETVKDTYNESGSLVKTEERNYSPKKVKIVTTSGMDVDMQMKVSEALKRSCAMKEAAEDRIKLLVRYLGIEFPDRTFFAVIGDGYHYVENDVYIKVIFDDNVYHIWGTLKSEEEDEE